MEIDGNTILNSLLAGGAAGFAVDVSLFPLDTTKTRLQSEIGFRASGGLRNIYSGIGPAALGSAPNAAVFFCAYEFTKKNLPHLVSTHHVVHHTTAAAVGEIFACLVRVPTDVIKQRRQVQKKFSSLQIFQTCLKHEGFFGLYRGYWSTLVREIPFSFIQYPLWEFLKRTYKERCGTPVNSWQSAVAGSIAGGVAAALTTPLDVAKTRIILAKRETKEAEGKIISTLLHIYKTRNIKGLYSGIVPRTLIMALGGAIYFGAYEFVILCM